VIGAELGVEGDREQPALSATRDPPADIQKRLAEAVTASQHDDLAVLLDHVEELLERGRPRDVGGLGEVTQLLQPEGGGGVVRRANGPSAQDRCHRDCQHTSSN